MRTTTYKLPQLLAEADRGTFVLPHFQRDFKWEAAKTKLLIDSISRNYPIGSVLLLEESNPQDPFLKSRSLKATLSGPEGPSDSQQSPGQYFYVLDGQQRLTSILHVLLQADTGDKKYYVDLNRLRRFHDDDSNSQWLIRRSSEQKSMRYLRSELIVDAKRSQSLVDEYFEEHDPELKGDRQSQRQATAMVVEIFETIRSYHIPVIILDRDESMESICRIFETINSTGKKLTTFDLAVARYFPEPDLHDLWERAKEDHPSLSPSQYDVDGERVLQVISAKQSVRNDRYPQITRSGLLSLDKALVGRDWASAAQELADAYHWAEKRGLTPRFSSNTAMMVPLAVFLASIDDAWRHENPDSTVLIERWYYSSILQPGARQASNYRIAESVSSLFRYASSKESLKLDIPRIDSKRLAVLTSRDSRYRAILAFIHWRMGRDIWSGEILDGDVEDHHLFPRSRAKHNASLQNVIDSIGNRIVVSKSTNRRLRDRLPSDYLGEIVSRQSEQGQIATFRALCNDACIDLPDDVSDVSEYFSLENAPLRIQERNERIAARIQAFVGTSTAAEDDDED